MAYDTPERKRYDIAGGVIVNFGTTTATSSYKFIGPKGKKGLVRDIEMQVTTNMVGATTVPEINVGATASVVGTLSTTYARFRLGTAAATGYTTTVGAIRARPLTLGNPTPPVCNDFTGHVALETASIPADTNFYVTLLEGAGSPTGAGNVWVEVDWF